MKVVWRETAERQYRLQIAYVRARNPGAVERLEMRVDACVAQLLQFPKVGRPSRKRGVRELVITQTPYIAVYRVLDDKIVIMRFFHGAQDR